QVDGGTCVTAAVEIGQTCTVTVRFAPQRGGVDSDARLTIADNTPAGSHTVALHGHSLVPVVTDPGNGGECGGQGTPGGGDGGGQGGGGGQGTPGGGDQGTPGGGGQGTPGGGDGGQGGSGQGGGGGQGAPGGGPKVATHVSAKVRAGRDAV